MPVTVPQPTDNLNWTPADANVQEPSAGKKVLGWIVNETIPSEETNWFWRAVSRWIAYAKDVIVNSYGVQHNIVTGAHTAITAITGIFSTSLTSPIYNFSPTGGIRLINRFIVNQISPYSTTGAGELGTIEQIIVGGRVLQALRLDPGENGILLIGQVGPATDVDQVTINFRITANADYQFTWHLRMHDNATATWGDPPGGPATALVTGTDTGTGFTSVTFNMPDQTPLLAGHGVGGFTTNRLIGISISNFPAGTTDILYIYHATTVTWVGSINNALGAG